MLTTFSIARAIKLTTILSTYKNNRVCMKILLSNTNVREKKTNKFE